MSRRGRPAGKGARRATPGKVARALHSAYARHRQGDLAGAERGYRRVLDLDSHNGPALHHLALMERGRGNLETARALFSRAVAAAPADAGCRNNFANLLQELGRPAEAVVQYREVLRAAPDHHSARYNLGKALQRLGDFEAAVECFEELCVRTPENAGAWCALGQAQQDAGAGERALASQCRALALDPSHAEAHNALGTVHLENGDFPEAEAAFRAALRCDPLSAPALGNLVRARRIEAEDLPLVERMESLLARARLPVLREADLQFALARAREDLGHYDRAFVHYREGNRCRRSALHYERPSAEKRSAALIRAFDSAFFARAAGQGENDARPVFIVGMPRSGTSLVEQILASHPGCFGAGELPSLGRTVRSMPPPTDAALPHVASVLSLGETTLGALGRAYLDALPPESGAALRVTDKMPQNYLYLGFVAAVLPGARVIHCRRSPMDVCFSIYAQNFTHLDAYPYAYDLLDIASEYLAYDEVMAHWSRTLPLAMHEVSYEHLVGNQEAATRELLAFCDLAFDARCLRFHETKRPVRTASQWQVRQPMYAASVGRWRHFEAHLEPLRAALEHGRSG